MDYRACEGDPPLSPLENLIATGAPPNLPLRIGSHGSAQAIVFI